MVHLHLHTSLGSRLDAISTSEEYAEKAHKFGHKAMAVTDHGRMSAVYEHQQACLKYGIKPILGVEAYLVDELVTLNEKDKRTRTKTNHIILLPKNAVGYKNLLYLNYISMKDTDHYYYVNRITKQELFDNKEGIIVGTACLGSKWSRLIIAGKIDEAEKEFKEFKDEFGEDFYAEIQLNEITDEIDYAKEGQKTVNEYILKFAEKYDVKVYIGGDVHYLNPGEDQLQSISIAIRNKETMDNLSWEIESRNMFYHNENDYIRFNKEFGYNYDEDLIHQWCDNSDLIADKCNYLIPEKIKSYLPKLYEDDDSKLIELAREGLKNKIPDISKEYTDRLNKELELIIRKGFSSYILILEDVFKFVEKENLWMGCGRGCYTKDAMVFTTNGFKSIDKVNIGDTVINEKGEKDEVINKFIYDIEEDLFRINYVYSSETFSPKTCTGDHKQLINREGKNIWVETKNINTKTDLICLPRIKTKEYNEIKELDLLDYNIYNYEYDEDYIYEVVPSNKPYKNSIRGLSKKYSISRNAIKNYLYTDKSKKETIKKIEEITKMTKEEYIKYINDNSFVTKKIKRKVKIDSNFFRMVGLLAGDGWISKKNNIIGFAINNSNKKDVWNKNEFYKFYDKFFENRSFLYENISKTKKLNQLYINSKIITEFMKKEMIFYDKEDSKFIDRKWLNRSKSDIRNIWKGLLYSDGHFGDSRINFDNTSLKLITNYCEISNRLGYTPIIQQREEHYKDKYLCKRSYKVRTSVNNFSKKHDDDFYYAEIRSINRIKNVKTKVYDLSIKNHQSFMIDNMITHNSGSGSLVLYCLNITTIDPIKYDLLFERFMSDARNADYVIDYFKESL